MSKLEEWMQKLMWYVEEMREEWINVCRPQFQQYDLLEMMLISKQYPLVKRLIDNDKIDLEWTEYSYYFKIKDKSYYSNDVPTENIILMLLTIQDEPIEFLISILK